MVKAPVKKSKSINVASQAIEFLKEMLKGGFNNIQVEHCEVECTWHEEYAIFILGFDFDIDVPDNQYVTIDYGSFYDDLLSYMKQKYFPKCTINYSSGCREWEIIGPNNAKFYKEHFDALEEFECNEYEAARKAAGREVPIIFVPKKKKK